MQILRVIQARVHAMRASRRGRWRLGYPCGRPTVLVTLSCALASVKSTEEIYLCIHVTTFGIKPRFYKSSMLPIFPRHVSFTAGSLAAGCRAIVLLVVEADGRLRGPRLDRHAILVPMSDAVVTFGDRWMQCAIRARVSSNRAAKHSRIMN